MIRTIARVSELRAKSCSFSTSKMRQTRVGRKGARDAGVGREARGNDNWRTRGRTWLLREREKGGWSGERVAIDAANYLQLSHLYCSLGLGPQLQTDRPNVRYPRATLISCRTKTFWRLAPLLGQVKPETRSLSHFDDELGWKFARVTMDCLLETLDKGLSVRQGELFI